MLLAPKRKLARAPRVGRRKLIDSIRGELASELEREGISAVFLLVDPLGSIHLLLPFDDHAFVERILGHSAEPTACGWRHFSGLPMHIHGPLPGGPSFESVRSRSTELWGMHWCPDQVDRLWLGALLLMIGVVEEIALAGGELWDQSGAGAMRFLCSRGAEVSRPGLLALARSGGAALSAEMESWLVGPTDRLAVDLILHGLSVCPGVSALRGLVGTWNDFRFRHYPTPEYRAWKRAKDEVRRQMSSGVL